jgi:hypothetical protein
MTYGEAMCRLQRIEGGLSQGWLSHIEAKRGVEAVKQRICIGMWSRRERSEFNTALGRVTIYGGTLRGLALISLI